MKRTTATLGWLLAAALAAGAQEAPTASASAVPATLAAVLASAAPGAATPAESPSNSDLFAAIAAAELSPAELAAVFGDGFNLFVNRARQTMTVTTYIGNSARENYLTIKTYQVPVVTSVVRAQDVALGVAKTAAVNTVRTVKVCAQPEIWVNPIQFPLGTYNIIGASKPSDPAYGDLQLRTDAAPSLTARTGAGTFLIQKFVDSGYNVHYTSASNTLGCIGVPVKADMDRLATDYQRFGVGSVATITVSK